MIEWFTDHFKTKVVHQPHEGLTYVERSQPNEDAILAANMEMQKDPILNDLTFGRWVARIPEIAFSTIIPKDYPDYIHGDGATRKATLMRMLVDHPEWSVQNLNRIIART